MPLWTKELPRYRITRTIVQLYVIGLSFVYLVALRAVSGVPLLLPLSTILESVERTSRTSISQQMRNTNVGVMLGQRRKRWINIQSILGYCLVFAGSALIQRDVTYWMF